MRIKYPRTPHLPSSPGATADDRRMPQHVADALFTQPVVVTEKMDGGNVTLTRDYFHARSTSDTTPRWERYAKSVWAAIAHDIPTGWRVSAESLWARRSVPYNELPGFLLVIGVWDDTNTLLSWPHTQEWAGLLGLPTVPVLGAADGECAALVLWSQHRDVSTSEGFVVRSTAAVAYTAFDSHVGKWVRPNHVQTTAAWRHSVTFPTNQLSNTT